MSRPLGPAMPRQRSSLFLHLKTDPNPHSDHSVWEHRKRQARPLISNPFEEEDSTLPDEATVAQLPSASPQSGNRDEEKVYEEPKESGQDNAQFEYKNLDTVWGEQPPEWLSLFYDLAWTATFSNLTTNYSFVSPTDTATYVVFFTIAWWIWVSQIFYTIDFYTDDWFHMICIGLQFVVFGALAALTQGLDILTYITHSPGSTTWSSDTLLTMDPKVYLAENSTRKMFERIALVVAISRLILFIQHARVLYYARVTSKPKRYPRRLLIVPLALLLSTLIFFGAYILTKLHGENRIPAIIKLAMWFAGVIIEVVAHIIRFQWDINNDLRLKSHGSIVNRFTGLTTIIVGEGINGIAGTLYKLDSAPGFQKKLLVGMGCSGVIIFLLVYLYFQGPAPQKPVRRRAAWSMLHWPWLLCVILLLQGVKNQLVLTNFLHSTWYLVDQADNIMYSDTSESQFNETFAKLLLQAGMKLVDESQKLEDLYTQNLTAMNATEFSDQAIQEIYNVWYYRVLTQGVVNIYTSFMSNDTIDEGVQNNITQYMYDYEFTFEDYRSDLAYNLENIIWGLIKPSVNNTRYIMGLSASTFIILALLNLVQSWPRDRFQWASIISRFTMGAVVALLALLNIGKYQMYFPPIDVSDSERAKLFGWIDKDAVLPTLATAYAIQFLVDTILIYLARYVSRIRLTVSKATRKISKSV